MQKNYLTKKRGFTFVELMVVLGIFALLFTTAMIASEATRDNANDRSIKSQFGLIRLEAEQSYRENIRRYGQACEAAGDLIAEIDSPHINCVDGRDGYAIQVELSTGEYYCMDTLGDPATYAGSTVYTGTSRHCNYDDATPADCTCGP